MLANMQLSCVSTLHHVASRRIMSQRVAACHSTDGRTDKQTETDGLAAHVITTYDYYYHYYYYGTVIITTTTYYFDYY